MNKNIFDILKEKDNRLSFLKDREETTSNYQGHSQTSSNFKSRKLKCRYNENDEWNKTKEVRSTSNKPQMNRLIYRTQGAFDALTSDLFMKPGDPSLFQASKCELPQKKGKQIYENSGRERYSCNEEQMNKNKKISNNCSDKFSNHSRFNNTQNGNQIMKTEEDQHEAPNKRYTSSEVKAPNKSKISEFNKLNNLSWKQLHQKQKNRQQQINQSMQENRQISPEKAESQRQAQSEFEGSSEPIDEYSDASIFDSISNQDWFKLVPEEVLSNKNIDLEKFFVDNSEYFYNLLCMNASLKGTKPMIFHNDHNSIKLKHSSGFNSTYHKDFFKKSSQSTSIPQITDKMMQTNFLGQRSIDFTSQMQNDYKDHGFQDVERRKPTTTISQKPFMGLTSYNSNFANWRDYNKILLKPPPHLSTVEAPLGAKSSYQDSYCSNPKLKGERAVIEKNTMFKGPIAVGPHFFGDTNYQTSFKHFKDTSSTGTSSSEINQMKSPTSNYYDSIPSFDGQFKSTSQKDYLNLKEDKFFASKLKKIWRQKIMTKLEELRDLREKQKKQ